MNIISEIYTVLDITNNKKDVPLKSILNKINTRNKVAKNKFKEEIHQSDLIVILEGFYKGCKAKVLHVYSDYVFLFGEKFDHT